MHQLRFTMPAIAPFRLDFTVWGLKRRDRNIVDNWEDNTYSRVLVVDNAPVKIEVQQAKDRISVVAKTARPIPKLKAKLAIVLDKMLGLNLDLSEFYEFANTEKYLKPVVIKFKGLKPPRFPTIFE